MLRYPVNLLGWGQTDSGEVVTNHGEYLGRWFTDAEYHPSFVPHGHSEVLFYEMFLGELCRRVREWSEMAPDDQARLLEESDRLRDPNAPKLPNPATT